MDYTSITQSISVFYGKTAPEEGFLVGYGALISRFNLRTPLPDRLSLISQKNRQYATEEWQVFTPRYHPQDTLMGHLTFALKYEGIKLDILKAIFTTVSKDAIAKLVASEPTGQYSRRIWFLYEWLMEDFLNIPDLTKGNFVELVDESLQYAGTAEIVRRQRIRNNLPGVKNFCPIIRKTATLEAFKSLQFSQKISDIFRKIHSDVMARTAAFLLLNDSRASYAIEGENPSTNRAQRWGKAIGQAGQKPLSKDELIRLQQIVIDDTRFTKMGWRTQGGFVGEHDRRTGMPIPDHISAKWEDVPQLIEGLIAANQKLENSQYDAVFAAASLAFGFVFIHPFVDGNGRIHRYLIHSVLARKQYVPKGIVFPISAVILERLDEYRQVLEAYSFPRLDLMDWKPTTDHNIEVTNATIDLYRYFDATKQAEFLYSCVQQTVEKTIPEEIDYLIKYDLMKSYLDNHFDMPDKTVALLVRFLIQGSGKLSTRAKSKEFSALREEEALAIENMYKEIFENDV